MAPRLACLLLLVAACGGTPADPCEGGACSARGPDRVEAPCRGAACSARRTVSVAELQRLLASPQGPLLIDLRPRADYDASHIPGAVPRAVHELAHTGLTRVGDPVLVTAGGNLGALAATLDALRAGGRDLRLLDGGMAAWCAAGGATTGPCGDPARPAPGVAMRTAKGGTYLSRGVDGARLERPFVAPKEGCGCL